MSNPKLHVVVTSTRPGRKGIAIGSWFEEAARAHGKHEVSLVDLADEDLPLLDEPNHPRLRQYTKEHTKRWSAKIDAADAFVFVMPEYNYAIPASMVNAVDFLFHEWRHKPAAFVSYGGVSGGLRAVQMAKQLLTSVSVMPIPEAVAIAMFAHQIDESGKFNPTEANTKAAAVMLDELHRWAVALKTMRG